MCAFEFNRHYINKGYICKNYDKSFVYLSTNNVQEPTLFLPFFNFTKVKN